MMDWLFNVFSRRIDTTVPQVEPVTTELRNRVTFLCRDIFSNAQTGDYVMEFWTEMHNRLEYLHGAPELAPESYPQNRAEDALYFVRQCSSEHFLDFVEYIFQLDMFWRFSSRADEMVENINAFFKLDDLPYHLTEYVQTAKTDPSSRYGKAIEVTSHPTVILREHDLMHDQVVEPALTLLTHPDFSSANDEFLEALEDYRQGDLGDCLTKCNSALESTLKIICAKKMWNYKQTETTSSLLNTVISNAGLPSFFTQPLMLIGTMRNRLSKSHGAGMSGKQVSPDIAKYALNATASAILLLVSEAL